MTVILQAPAERQRASAPRWDQRLVSSVQSHPRTAILASFCVLAFLLFSSTWIAPFTRIIGGPGGDQVGFFWGLEWPVWAVTHGHNPFFSTYLNAPAGFNVMWTYPPLPGLLMAPVTLMAGPVFSYNLLLTLGLAVSGWLMAIATRRLVSSWTAAVAAGLLFGFGPYEISQSFGHVVLVLQFAAPLLLLLGHELPIRQRWRPWQIGGAIGLVMAAQILTFIETAAILLVASALGLAALWLVRDPGWRRRVPHAVRSMGIAVIVAGVVCVYPLGFMLFGAEHMNSGAVRAPGTFVSNLANFVVASPAQLIAPTHSLGLPAGTSFDANPPEWNAYLGIPLLLVIAVVVRRLWSRDRLVRFLALMGATIALLSLGQRLWLSATTATSVKLPAAFFDYVPLLENILWSRVAVIVDLFAAALLAVYIAQSRRERPLLPRAWHRALMIALVLTLVPLFPYPSVPAPQVPPFFTGAQLQRIQPGSVALVAPFTRDGSNVEPEDWQIAGAFRFRMTGGYVFVPGPHGPSSVLGTPLNVAMTLIANGERGSGLSASSRQEMLTEVTQDHIETVIVGPMPHRAAMVRFMTGLFGRAPEEDQGVEVWWHVA